MSKFNSYNITFDDSYSLQSSILQIKIHDGNGGDFFEGLFTLRPTLIAALVWSLAGNNYDEVTSECFVH